MREILFKAKTCVGEWVQGLLAHKDSKWYISNKAGMPFAYEVRPDTICQYTGLTDKNGNKIWENDILCSNRKEKYFVKWRFCGFELLHRACATPIYAYAGTDLYVNEHTLNLEVIGNIFDNPELLEGSE